MATIYIGAYILFEWQTRASPLASPGRLLYDDAGSQRAAHHAFGRLGDSSRVTQPGNDV